MYICMKQKGKVQDKQQGRRKWRSISDEECWHCKCPHVHESEHTALIGTLMQWLFPCTCLLNHCQKQGASGQKKIKKMVTTRAKTIVGLVVGRAVGRAGGAGGSMEKDRILVLKLSGVNLLLTSWQRCDTFKYTQVILTRVAGAVPWLAFGIY